MDAITSIMSISLDASLKCSMLKKNSTLLLIKKKKNKSSHLQQRSFENVEKKSLLRVTGVKWYCSHGIRHTSRTRYVPIANEITLLTFFFLCLSFQFILILSDYCTNFFCNPLFPRSCFHILTLMPLIY